MGDPLEEIRERHAAASNGPWGWEDRLPHGSGEYVYNLDAFTTGVLTHRAKYDIRKPDKEFLEHAWSDVACLLGMVDGLLVELAFLRDHPGGVDPQTGSEK